MGFKLGRFLTDEEFSGLSAPEVVLGFLAANTDRAFEAHEITKQTALDEGSVNTALIRLEACDLIEHKATYWAVTTDHALWVSVVVV